MVTNDFIKHCRKKLNETIGNGFTPEYTVWLKRYIQYEKMQKSYEKGLTRSSEIR